MWNKGNSPLHFQGKGGNKQLVTFYQEKPKVKAKGMPFTLIQAEPGRFHAAAVYVEEVWLDVGESTHPDAYCSLNIDSPSLRALSERGC